MNTLVALSLVLGSLESTTDRSLNDGWFRFTLIEQAEYLPEPKSPPELIPAPKESDA